MDWQFFFYLIALVVTLAIPLYVLLWVLAFLWANVLQVRILLARRHMSEEERFMLD